MAFFQSSILVLRVLFTARAQFFQKSQQQNLIQAELNTQLTKGLYKDGNATFLTHECEPCVEIVT